MFINFAKNGDYYAMKHLELGFVGFGLIGGSIARSLKKQNEDVSVHVYSRRKNPALDEGMAEGIIDSIWYEIDERFSTCDIIFLCAPVLKNTDYLSVLKPLLKPGCILTDVGSVKGNICKKAAELGLSRQFIGGHPMAGSEKTGFENSTDILLENAYYLLTPFEETPLENLSLLKELVAKTGANCVVLSPSEHDKITAAISHVPHIIAVSLVNMVRTSDNEEQNMKAFAAGGFKDITRIASSSPQMWQDICLANSESIDYFLSHFEKQIENAKEELTADELEQVEHVYSMYEYNSQLYQENKEYLEKSVLMQLNPNEIPTVMLNYQFKKDQADEELSNIDDRAGAIATIATILSVNGISIKNIGIIHNREYVDGVMKLELYKEDDEKKARELLIQNRYDIVDRD